MSGVVQQPHFVPEPLESGPGDKNAALQGIADLFARPGGNGGEQSPLGGDRFHAGVHQQKAAGAVGAFHVSRFKAALAEEGGLLVSRGGGNGDGAAEFIRLAKHMAAGQGLGQQGGGDAEVVQQLLVPPELVDVKEHGPGGVGVVRGMNPPAGEIPDEPGVHGAEPQFSTLRPLPGAGNVVQNPLQLAGGKVGVGNQPGFLPDGLLQPVPPEPFDAVRRPAALPDDGVIDGLSGGGVPDQGGFSLVGDADGGDFIGPGVGLLHGLHGDAHLGGPDVHRVVLHPAGAGINLGKFLLHHGPDLPLPVEEDAPGAGGALVHGDHIVFHVRSS